VQRQRQRWGRKRSDWSRRIDDVTASAAWRRWSQFTSSADCDCTSVRVLLLLLLLLFVIVVKVACCC